MRASVFMTCLCTIAVAACDGSGGDGTPKGTTQTVQFDANSDGSLNYCDSSGNCQSLPNPNNCKTLTVTIDTGSGQACQVCTAADGTAGPQDCKTPSVACEVITIPNPDCVVCAYVNGTVIFSSCQPTAPICYTANADGSTTTSGGSGSGTASPGTGTAVADSTNIPAGSAPPTDAAGVAITPAVGCTICIDSTGNRVSQDCPPTCQGVLCPAIDCAIGYQVVTAPGDCCGHCEPITDCSGVACEMAVPVCPDGQTLTKDPTQCCGWYCTPTVCNYATPAGATTGTDTTSTAYMCPLVDIAIACQPGYTWSTAAPHCCGACVPSTCTSSADCAAGQICALPPCACIPDANGGCSVSSSCVGHCSG